jgi:hypothetical protein
MIPRLPVADRRTDPAVGAPEDDQDAEPAVELLEEIGEPHDRWVFGTEAGRVADLARDLSGLVGMTHSREGPHFDAREN